jgi:hypothetical protein
MRRIGQRLEPVLSDQPSAQALAEGAQFSAVLHALASVGFPKGVYRNRTHEDANRHEEACLAQAMASLAHQRR